MKARVTFLMEANNPHDWTEMHEDPDLAFWEFITGAVGRIGGGCTATVESYREVEVNQ